MILTLLSKWLCRPTHDLSQYKIWTNLDKWLLIEIWNKKKFRLCACALWVSCEVYDDIFRQSIWIWTKANHDTMPFKRRLHLQIITLKDFNFGPYLHNQDDVIWSWPYYKKWVCRPTHDLSQYKIWTSGCWDMKQREIPIVRMRTMSVLRS